MNEDGSHQGSENRISPVAEHGPSLDSETGSEMLGKSTENSLEASAGDSVRGGNAELQPKISEMHNDLIRSASYGLWMSSGAPVVGNVDSRNQGLSRESSVYWPPMFPMSSLPGFAAAGKNVTFDRRQKISSCCTDTSTTSRNSDIERIVSSDSDEMKKERLHFRLDREQEQFSLWKMKSLIRNISPSNKDRRMGSSDKDEMEIMLCHAGSSMNDGKTVERSWKVNCGRNEHQAKMKSASGGLLYPVFGSEAGNGNFDEVRKPHLVEKTTEDRDNVDISVMRSRREWAEDQLTYVLTLKPSEQLPVTSSTSVCETMKPSLTQSCGQSSEAPEDQRQARTRDAETNSLSRSDSLKGPGNVQVPVGSDQPVQHGDIASKFVGVAPVESVLSGVAGIKTAHDKLPACSLPVSESTSNGSSLYRRRVKNLHLRWGNSLTEEMEAELPKSPRIQNHFASAFEHGNTSQGDTEPYNGCGNFHKEKRDWEHTDEVNGGTDVALCHSPKESEYKNKSVASMVCPADSPVEQEVSKSDKLSGISYRVVNYATVSSEAAGQDYRPSVSGVDCGYTGLMTKEGVRPTCIEKGLCVNAGDLRCHGGCGALSRSACQCCGDIAARHLPVKVSPAAMCDGTTTKCCVTHRLGALPTPTRACAAALCQLSSSAHTGSPKCMETSSGCPFSHPGNQYTTPCHQAAVKCGFIGDGHLSPTHQWRCPYSMKKSLSRAYPARICHQDCLQQSADNCAPPHTPCMAHTPYTPRETFTPREPDTPQASDGAGEPCTSQSACSHRARKYPCTPTTACFFQFPPLHAIQLDCPGGAVCQTPSYHAYARRLPSCHTPCMSPLNLTIGQSCVTHSCTPQCCHPHQKLTPCTEHRRHSCVCRSACLFDTLCH